MESAPQEAGQAEKSDDQEQARSARALDPELRVMGQCDRLIAVLEADAQDRITEWLRARACARNGHLFDPGH